MCKFHSKVYISAHGSDKYIFASFLHRGDHVCISFYSGTTGFLLSNIHCGSCQVFIQYIKLYDFFPISVVPITFKCQERSYMAGTIHSKALHTPWCCYARKDRLPVLHNKYDKLLYLCSCSSDDKYNALLGYL